MAGQRLTDKTELTTTPGTGDLLMIVDVNDTTSSAEGTSKKIDNKFFMQTDKISISTGEFTAMDDDGDSNHRKTLVSPPGAGLLIVPFCAVIFVTYNGSVDTSNKTLNIGYDNVSTANTFQLSRFYSGATSDRTYILNNNGSSFYDYAGFATNKGLYAYASGNFNGDFSADLYISYRIIDIS